MRDHDRIEELLAARALGGLDAEDAERLDREQAAHGPGCEECARLERESAEVAVNLALSLDPVPVRAGLEDEIVTRALGPSPPVGRSRPARRPRAVWRGLGLVAAAAALVLGGWVLRDLTLPDTGEGPPAGFLAQASIVRFEGSGEGTLAVAFKPGASRAYLVGTGLPAPAPDEVYELWLIHAGLPVSGGCFVPDGGSVARPVRGDVGAAELLAITLEPGCTDAPTTEPILTAEPTLA